MSKIIDSTSVIASITFLWYRKGRLWNFYDSILSKSIKQVKEGSINRNRWEEIALEQCALLTQETFHGLFRFEVEYLTQKVHDNKEKLWISDSGSTTDAMGETETIEYVDKEQFCKNTIRQLYLSDIQFCGLGLFARSLKWWILRKEDKDTGVIKTRSKP